MKIDMRMSYWVPIIIMLVNIAAISLIKFNDLRHLSVTMQSVVEKVNGIAERVARIEGYIEPK